MAAFSIFLGAENIKRQADPSGQPEGHLTIMTVRGPGDIEIRKYGHPKGAGGFLTRPHACRGEVPEWTNGRDWKSRRGYQLLAGSNPALSAIVIRGKPQLL